MNVLTIIIGLENQHNNLNKPWPATKKKKKKNQNQIKSLFGVYNSTYLVERDLCVILKSTCIFWAILTNF